MAYVDLGEGDEAPVVFIHGLGVTWQSWLEVLPRVAEQRRAVAMDLPGFGDSEMPADKISISAYAHWVDEFCERIGVDRAVVVGSSLGGFVAAELAISHPARVERLVLAAAAGISITAARRRPVLTFVRTIGAVGGLRAARARQIVGRPRLRHLLLGGVIRHPSLLRHDLLVEILQGTGAPGVQPGLDALLSYDFTERLPEISCPTLIVWGNKDVLVPVEDADEFERLVPDARKVVFDDTGHGPMLERPTLFNDCLTRFLAEEAADEPPPDARERESAVEAGAGTAGDAAAGGESPPQADGDTSAPEAATPAREVSPEGVRS